MENRRTWVINNVSDDMVKELVMLLLSRGDSVAGIVSDYNHITDICAIYPDTFLGIELKSTEIMDLMLIINDIFIWRENIDGIVVTQGTFIYGALEEVSPGLIAEYVHREMTIPIQLIRLFVPTMRRLRRGRVVSVSHTTDNNKASGMAIVQATTQGLNQLILSLQGELTPFDIDVSVFNLESERTSHNDKNQIYVNLMSEYDSGPAHQFLLDSEKSPGKLKSHKNKYAAGLIRDFICRD